MVRLPDSSAVDVAPLAASFNHVTNSYKFYWFLAILESIKVSSKPIVPVDVLLARMIAGVWYPLHYFHLSLGKQDRLGMAGYQLKAQDDRLARDASPKDIQDAVLLHVSNRSPLAQSIRSLGDYVPQRFLRPFFHGELRGIDDWKANDAIEALAESGFHSTTAPCLYRFVTLPEKSIEIQPVWLGYLQEHLEILTGFCLWHLTNYVQKNNPNVPNVAGKLLRPEQRDLKQARAFWRLAINEWGEFRCIYSQRSVPADSFSLDHFLPWSYVAHDLLWNLVPTWKSVNSAKGNQLPDVSLYFDSFARLQFDAVQAVAGQRHGRLLEDYAFLFKRDIVADLLSIPFESFRQVLLDTIAPQVQIARNMGFPANWRYTA